MVICGGVTFAIAILHLHELPQIRPNGEDFSVHALVQCVDDVVIAHAGNREMVQRQKLRQRMALALSNLFPSP